MQHLNPEKYAGLTGLRQIGALRFAAELKARGIPHWLRYVLIPGHTDDEDGLERLVKFCQGQQPALQGVELLPYHLLGRNKWEELGLQYPLDGVETPPLEAVSEQLYHPCNSNSPASAGMRCDQLPTPAELTAF